MDRLTAVAGCLFVAADVFAVVSLVNPDWINTGTTPDAFTIGLARQCQTIRGRERACTPPRLPAEWLLALLMMVCGVALLTAACALLLLSRWRRDLAVHARWIAFAASESAAPPAVAVLSPPPPTPGVGNIINNIGFLG
ncbi:uncharacterized protein C16orf52 homolog B-like [Lampetra fluviatilis]